MAGQFVLSALLFGVGILVGQQFCTEAPEPPPPPECPEPSTRVVEHCPEEPEEEPVAEPDPDPPEQPRESESDPLPDEPPPVDPQQRRRMLAWARDQSATLEGCPRDLGTTHRLGITIELDDDNAIDGVSITADEPLDGELRTCLEDRISQWTLPDEFEPRRRELFFGLTL